MKRVFRLALGLVAALVVMPAAAETFDFDKECDQLLEFNGESASGFSEETGLWAIAVGHAPIEGNDTKTARQKASLDAKKAMASFLSAQVASAAEMSMSEKDGEYSSSYAQWTRVDVNAMLKGVSVKRIVKKDGEMIAVALMLQKTIDATKLLESMKDEEGPNAVKASGSAETREAAIQAACRAAVEQVNGVSLAASDADSSEGRLRSREYSRVQGMVSSYRVVDESTDGELVHVTIVAEIDKDKLKEDYGADVATIGDPIFWITADQDEVAVEISDFLMEKGLKTSIEEGPCDYKVVLRTKFRTVTHPADGRKGTRVELVAVCYDKAGVQLFTLQNEPRRAVTFIGTPEVQQVEAMKKATKQLSKPLHERLQRAIGNMVNNGRTVRMIFRNTTSRRECKLIEELVETINEMPEASSATYSRDEENETATIRLNLKGNPQDFLGRLRDENDDCPEALEVSPNTIIFEF